jgi:hypothetical protein
MSELDLPDGTYTAVVDTIEDGYATVFFERDGQEVGTATLAPSHLPAAARHADAILDITIRDESLESATYAPERTKTRQESAQDRFDHLSERPPTNDDE